MDWQGQKLAEQLMQIMLVVFAVAALLTGYIMESFQSMMFIYAGGIVLATLITIPSWPFFNRESLKWLDPNFFNRESLKWLDPNEIGKHPKPHVTGLISKK